MHGALDHATLFSYCDLVLRGISRSYSIPVMRRTLALHRVLSADTANPSWKDTPTLLTHGFTGMTHRMRIWRLGHVRHDRTTAAIQRPLKQLNITYRHVSIKLLSNLGNCFVQGEMKQILLSLFESSRSMWFGLKRRVSQVVRYISREGQGNTPKYLHVGIREMKMKTKSIY